MSYQGPGVDHSLISPNGRMSKRSKVLAQERTRRALFGDGLAFPSCPQPSDKEYYLRKAAEFRDLAARGVQSRRHLREAERMEALAKECDNDRAPAIPS